MTAHGWTIDEAFGEFERAGMPVDRTGFRAVVRAARRTGKLQPVGETASGERGGRGRTMYEIGALQQLHAALSPWLTPPGAQP
jgi:hypothetical protein